MIQSNQKLIESLCLHFHIKNTISPRNESHGFMLNVSLRASTFGIGYIKIPHQIPHMFSI